MEWMPNSLDQQKELIQMRLPSEQTIPYPLHAAYTTTRSQYYREEVKGISLVEVN
jgi:hypothetical protein